MNLSLAGAKDISLEGYAVASSSMPRHRFQAAFTESMAAIVGGTNKQTGLAPKVSASAVSKKVLGRKLTPEDFPRHYLFNHPHMPGTSRLKRRQR